MKLPILHNPDRISGFAFSCGEKYVAGTSLGFLKREGEADNSQGVIMKIWFDTPVNKIIQ